jgi:hypothetical protein
MSNGGYFDVPYFTLLFTYQQLMHTSCELITSNILVHVSVENTNIIIICGFFLKKIILESSAGIISIYLKKSQ